MPRYEREENNSGSGHGAMIGLVAAGIGVLAAAFGLQSLREKNRDNELQREHEREMARRSETNPNIKVQTGRVTIEHHHHGETSQSTPAALQEFQNIALKACVAPCVQRLQKKFD